MTLTNKNNIPYYSGNYTTKEFILNMTSSYENYHYIRDILTHLVKNNIEVNFNTFVEDIINSLCKYGGVKGDLDINFIDRKEVIIILKEYYGEIKKDLGMIEDICNRCNVKDNREFLYKSQDFFYCDICAHELGIIK
tara:strand:- start:35 stop:445 length:411 start_codon:yes stop_codon:yes gene_type:complete